MITGELEGSHPDIRVCVFQGCGAAEGEHDPPWAPGNEDLAVVQVFQDDIHFLSSGQLASPRRFAVIALCLQWIE